MSSTSHIAGSSNTGRYNVTSNPTSRGGGSHIFRKPESRCNVKIVETKLRRDEHQKPIFDIATAEQ